MRLPPGVEAVVQQLDARSRQEQAALEVLRAQGGGALRERAGSFMLDVGPDVGLLLNLLVRAKGARSVIEIGGSVGYSTLWLADAVRATGGRLYSIEVDPAKQREQEANLEAAGLRDVVELTSVEAVELVPQLPAPLDFVLLDHWKELYVRDFDACWSRLAVGGMVVADNILVPVKNAATIDAYRRHVRARVDARTLLLSIGDGVELTLKVEPAVGACPG